MVTTTNMWSAYAGDIYRSQRSPLLTSVRVQRIAELTKEKMKGRDGALLNAMKMLNNLDLTSISYVWIHLRKCRNKCNF